jgi:hypothetical protein
LRRRCEKGLSSREFFDRFPHLGPALASRLGATSTRPDEIQSTVPPAEGSVETRCTGAVHSPPSAAGPREPAQLL